MNFGEYEKTAVQIESNRPKSRHLTLAMYLWDADVAPKIRGHISQGVRWSIRPSRSKSNFIWRWTAKDLRVQQGLVAVRGRRH